MFGLVVIEVMTPSGHLSDINEMLCVWNIYLQFQIYVPTINLRLQNFLSLNEKLKISLKK